MTFMVEIRTPVCQSLAQVHQALGALRRRVDEVAGRHGVLTVASGAPPYGMPDPPLVTGHARYLALMRRFPLAMSTNGTCACHVHVAVASRQEAVAALRRLRPWLPPLIAMTANSPIWEGRDTSWASRRLLLLSRWPTVVPPPPVRSVEEYDERIRRTIAIGDALDERSVYFLARLSPRYPTIEVRAADVCLTVGEAVAYAGLVRALVATAVADAVTGRPEAPVAQAVLRRACRSAAREGLGGAMTHPRTGDLVPSWEAVDALVAHVGPRLDAHGDTQEVLSALARLRASGGGAERQRRLFRDARSPADFAAALSSGGQGEGPSGV
jgi:carboxylate-amine ligase